MPEDKRDSFLYTQICDPIPGEHAFRCYDKVLPVWSNDLEKGFAVGSQVLVKSDFTILIEDADIHLFCVKVDPAIIFVLFGVKSHLASSFG
jgi:hypothetical protein